MKKVSVITLQNIKNYGSMLQAYATQELLRDKGYEAEIVDFNFPMRLTEPVINGDNMFCPTFQMTPKEVKALNVNNDFVGYQGGLNPGSTFIYNLRQVRPFEAYMASVSDSQAPVSIFGEQPTTIGMLPQMEWKESRLTVYSIAGQMIRSCENTTVEQALHGLAPGVYVVNGRKMVVR